MRSGDKPRPSLKSKNKIPKSPNSRSASLLENICKLYGPRMQPISRNNSVGFVPNEFDNGMTNTVTNKKVKMSRPNEAKVSASIELITCSVGIASAGRASNAWRCEFDDDAASDVISKALPIPCNTAASTGAGSDKQSTEIDDKKSCVARQLHTISTMSSPKVLFFSLKN